MTAVFVDVFCPLVALRYVSTLAWRRQKLISEGTAIRTERSFLIVLRYLLVLGYDCCLASVLPW